MIYYLNRTKHLRDFGYIDRKKIMNKYNSNILDKSGMYNEWVIQKYRMTRGFPILINVEGMLVTLGELTEICLNKDLELMKWISEVRTSPANLNKKQITFRWK